MKKTITKAILILAIMSVMMTTAFAASPESDFVFKDGTITKYIGQGGNVIIPSTIDGQAVTVIEQRAFMYCDSLTEITIPDSVTGIGNYAFLFCDALTQVTIPDSVTSIGYNAFAHCDSLIEITIPNRVTNIGKEAFLGCEALTEITIPDSVTSIGYHAFAGCESLTEITISDSVTSIGYRAFLGCDSLTEITIPDSVTSIGYEAFWMCEALADVYYVGTEEQWNEINPDNQANFGFFYDDNVNDVERDVTYHFNYSAHTPLPSATLYTSYLTEIPDMTTTATLVSGALPKGLGIYPDGTIGGIPTQSGDFKFVVRTANGEVGYSITVLENTSANVEADNDFVIETRVPTVTSNENDYIYKVSGEYDRFLNVYLNGVMLIRDVEYTVEEGSTLITLKSQTTSQLATGNHTINATFAPVNVNSTVSSSVTVQNVAQTFEKTVEKTTEPAMPFSDVTEADWFYNQVLFVYKQGTFQGTSDTTYSPDDGMNRAMTAVVLHSLAGYPESESANLADVGDNWYTNAVNWLVTSGIDNSATNFRPTEDITREEMAVMIYNFCAVQEIYLPLVTSDTASDMDIVSNDAKTAVDALYQRNIFGGDQYGNFSPNDTSTRAQGSIVMKNFISIVM